MLAPLIELFESKNKEIEDWFDLKWSNLVPLPYLSCDIRHSGEKISVVDTNLFPGGFNNLCAAFSKATVEAFKEYFKLNYPRVQKIMIYAEEHTRNRFYLENLIALENFLVRAGYTVKIALLGETVTELPIVVRINDHDLTLHKINRKDNVVISDDFKPDIILSNNDFSSGFPELLQDIEQEIIPTPHLGWHNRTKVKHFLMLKDVIHEFCLKFDIDAWRLFPLMESVDDIDVNDDQSLEILSSHVENLLARIKEKYDEYGIEDQPYVYVKSNRGTYGMGVVSVSSGDEVLALNRKKRKKLGSLKGKLESDSFLIQEGIPTIDQYSGFPIEPVIYAVGKNPVGGFFRIHETKNMYESLNAPGMSFSCLCLHKLDEPHEKMFINCCEKDSVVKLSNFLTRIACLAAASE